MRDRGHAYSWYDTNDATNGGGPGTETPISNPGVCGSTLTNCNMEEYVAAVNATSLCSLDDWRMPTREELRSIVDYGIAFPGPTIDTIFFPNTPGSFFWSASGYAGGSGFAWDLCFSNGDDLIENKDVAGRVRLVRGG
ncbi:MAG: DUF1566 domain-containing protein [Candidatus Competibacteraceae bacterium]|nr:DUF1566 domain-containing protein [Candidatus Competibacteraceae bacterium]